MKEEDFNILLSIYKHRNLSKAAEELFVTQPTLSYRVKQIEKDLDIKLFNKDNNLFFTDEGEMLVEFSKQKLEEFSHLRSKLKALKEDGTNLINIGVSTNFAMYKLPLLLEKFLNKHPYINVTVYSGWSHQIIDGLNDYDLHVGIVTGEYKWFDKKILISKDPLMVISNEPLDLKNLPNLPRINYKPKTIHERRSTPLKPIESEIDHWWNFNYMNSSNTIMNLDTIETCKEMVARGLGYSIIPSTALSKNDSFFSYELKNPEGDSITRNTYLLYKHNYFESKSINQFIDFIVSQIN